MNISGLFVDGSVFKTHEFWEMILHIPILSLGSKPSTISFCYTPSPALIICYFPVLTPPLKADIEFLLSPPLFGTEL